jgi:hypothetical protein
MLVAGSPRDLDDGAEFVIVGSGAAGSTAARWIANSGRSVIVVEEGAPPKAARGDAWEALTTLYRDGGAMAAMGRDVLPLLQGRCVGGTTVVNGAIQVPLPEEVWQQWVAQDRRWAERLPLAELEAHRERNDREFGVTKTPRELWGGAGSAMFQGLAGKATATWRNAPGCVGPGRCLQGCPHGAKQSADVAMLQKAMAQGARTYARCKVERVVFEGGRAVGVDGAFEIGKRLKVRANVAVMVAASAIQTPWLLQVSGVKGVGVGFMCHPGAAMAGLFAKAVEDLPAATQAMESHAFGPSASSSKHWASPGLFALRGCRASGMCWRNGCSTSTTWRSGASRARPRRTAGSCRRGGARSCATARATPIARCC